MPECGIRRHHERVSSFLWPCRNVLQVVRCSRRHPSLLNHLPAQNLSQDHKLLCPKASILQGSENHWILNVHELSFSGKKKIYILAFFESQQVGICWGCFLRWFKQTTQKNRRLNKLAFRKHQGMETICYLCQRKRQRQRETERGTNQKWGAKEVF